MARYKPTPAKTLSGWYTVPGYSYFLVNRQGLIRNAKTGYETYGSLDDKGYRRVCQWDNASRTKREYKAHQIVCAAFHGPCPSALHEVGHKDDDRANNVPGNLQWITRKDNMTKANKKRTSMETADVLSACIITGNPKYIENNPLAQSYYQEIETYLTTQGFAVTYDAGEAYTCPPKSDLYVAHSRGVGRSMCVKDDWRFLMFGDIDGVMHPKDRAYHRKYSSKFDTNADIPPPPNEHYLFIKEQRQAIDDAITRVGQVSHESEAFASAYVARTLTDESLSLLVDLQSRLGIEHPIPPEDIHLTLMYSPAAGIPEYQVLKRPLVSTGQWVLKHLGGDQRTVAIVLQGDSDLQSRHRELQDLGARHTFTPFMAHVSLSYDDHISKAVHDSINWSAHRKLTFIREYMEPIKPDAEPATEALVPSHAPISLSW